MKTINNIAEWIRSISSGEVKYGSLSRYSAHALRCAASNFNKTLGHDRGIFVHIHFDWDKMIAIAVCISVAETGQTHQNYSDKNCNISNCKALIINALDLLMLDKFRIFIV